MKGILFSFYLLACCFVLSACDISNPVHDGCLVLESTYIDKAFVTDLERDAVEFYGLKSDVGTDQSFILQYAIDDVSRSGGGRLIIPEGEYSFINVHLKSDVHVLVSKDAVLKPYYHSGEKNAAMFIFSSEEEHDGAYISNCSIRGLDGSFTVDYSFLKPGEHSRIRFALVRLVKNFLIADVEIKDNFTTFCGISLVPATASGADEWFLSRPTDGEIRNCSIENADSGYGLCQLHGAQSVYFENLYAEGGVTLRLETGAGADYNGIYDIKARKVVNERGRAALMMNPHCAHNGKVMVDGVLSRSSSFCLLFHDGFIDRKHKDDPDAEPGTFADGCIVSNAHAVFGTDAQVDLKEVYVIEPDERLYSLFRRNHHGNEQSLDGPSLAAAYSTTQGHWSIEVVNLSSEGFNYHSAGLVRVEDIRHRFEQRWEIVRKLPLLKSDRWVKPVRMPQR